MPVQYIQYSGKFDNVGVVYMLEVLIYRCFYLIA